MALDSAEFDGRVEDCWEDGGLCKCPDPAAGLEDSTTSSPGGLGSQFVFFGDVQSTANSESQPAAVQQFVTLSLFWGKSQMCASVSCVLNLCCKTLYRMNVYDPLAKLPVGCNARQKPPALVSGMSILHNTLYSAEKM